MTTTVSVASAYKEDQADILATALNSGGNLIIYSGTIPATPETADTGTALVTLPFATTAASSTTNGVITFTVDPNMTSVSITTPGTASHFRAKTSTNTVVFQGEVGTSGKAITVDSTTFISGGTITISSLQLTIN